LSDLLLELGSEELPARFVAPAAQELSAKVVALLDEARLEHGPAQAFGTPRRLTVCVPGLSERQPSLDREVLGPPTKAAFDAQGKPTRAAEGFAKVQGVEVAALRRVQTERGEYLGLTVHEEGRSAAELLPPLLAQAIAGLGFPKSMRWGAVDVTYARPLQWICARLGVVTLRFQYGDVDSGSKTHGHRFLSPGPYDLKSPGWEGYLKQMRDLNVLANAGERTAMVEAQVKEAAERVGGQALLDPALLAEVANLVEWPTAIEGSFDPGFLDLPREVLISEMQHHQRYFPVVDGAGKLLPHFVAVSATPVRDPATARHGYWRVLRARLADARFFYQEDLKRKLGDRVEDLKNVMFQVQLGTVWEKTARVRSLAGRLAEPLRMDPATRAALDQAALLCKADLTTSMVGEFPDLQGVVGKYYAERSGEAGAVAQAIEEHYLPRFSGDRLPQSEAGLVLAIADRLDTICGMFGVGKQPTGSADPFALRRAALGVIQLVLHARERFSLRQMIQWAFDGLASKVPVPPIDPVRDFFRARLKALWGEEHRPDVVEAILSADCDDLLGAQQRLQALSEIVGRSDFLPLAAAFKRAVNILGQAPAGDLDGEIAPALLKEEAEQQLHQRALDVRVRVDKLLASGDYGGALRELTSLKPEVDRFFEKVMVMAEDAALRRNRLRLLASLKALFCRFADLSQIQAEPLSGPGGQ
jgi:glycyl-tRNA synthetase beta chain